MFACVRGIWISGAAASLLMFAGCQPPPAPVYVVEAAPRATAVPAPPPATREELRPAQPEDGWVWIAGYWHWNGDDYQWEDGQWVAPRDGYSYYAPTYVFVNNSWIYQPGYWYQGPMGGLTGGGKRHGHHSKGHKGKGHKGNKGSGVFGGSAPVSPGSETPSKVRVSAPPSDGADQQTPGKVRVTAPPAPTGKDPDRSRSRGKDGATNPASGGWDDARRKQARRKDGHLPAHDEQKRRRQGAGSKGAGDEARLPAHDEQKRRRQGAGASSASSEPAHDHDTPTYRPRTRELRRRDDFRGTRKGRMVFSNIPDGQKRYPTDRTGAIVLRPEEGTTWKTAARVKPGGHRPDPSVVEVHTGDPRRRLRVRRTSSEQARGVRQQQPTRRRVVVDTRQRTHFKTGSGTRSTVSQTRRVPTRRVAPSAPGSGHVYRNTPTRVVRQPRRVYRSQPRRVVHQPRRVVYQPRRARRSVVHRTAARSAPRRVIHVRSRPVPTSTPPKKRQRRPAPTPPPARDTESRKRRR